LFENSYTPAWKIVLQIPVIIVIIIQSSSVGKTYKGAAAFFMAASD